LCSYGSEFRAIENREIVGIRSGLCAEVLEPIHPLDLAGGWLNVV
jgi:hypothetical protein